VQLAGHLLQCDPQQAAAAAVRLEGQQLPTSPLFVGKGMLPVGWPLPLWQCEGQQVWLGSAWQHAAAAAAPADGNALQLHWLLPLLLPGLA
jgi:hypothetical protein